MADGPSHYKEAERILASTVNFLLKTVTEQTDPADAALFIQQHSAHLAAAQVHATLALAAATVANNQMLGPEAAKARVGWQPAIAKEQSNG